MAYVNLIDLVYPVGAVYISYVSTSPVSLFGGSWVAITGRFPYFNAGTSQGGSNTHTLTVAQMPSHTHTMHNRLWVTTGDTSLGYAHTSYWGYRGGSDILDRTESTGSGQSHNNMPAYQTLYAWRRTA